MNRRERFDKWFSEHVAIGFRCEEEAAWAAWNYALDTSTPEWEHAPDWADWLAMDAGGRWWWFAEKPETRATSWGNAWGKWIKEAGLTPGRTGWTETLEQRP